MYCNSIYLVSIYGVFYLKKCTFCNAELPDEAIYCLNCSTALNEKQAFSNAVLKNTKRKRVKAAKTGRPALYFSSKGFKYTVVITAAVAIISVSGFAAIRFIKSDVSAQQQSNFDLSFLNERSGNSMLLNNGNGLGNLLSESEENTANESLSDSIVDNEYTSVLETVSNGSNNGTESNNSSVNGKSDNSTLSVSSDTNSKNTESVTESNTNTDTADKLIPQNCFKYTEINGKIKITEYTGNASRVVVPAFINNKHVAYLGENAFANNSNIKEIVFTGTTSGSDMFYLPAERTVFYNLPNLTSVTFPYETDARLYLDSGSTGNTTFYKLFSNCPKISGIYFTGKINNDYPSSTKTMFSVDGVVFSSTSDSSVSWNLLYYPPNKKDSSYTIPSKVLTVSKYAFLDNNYLTEVHFTEYNHYLDLNFIGCNNLKTFFVDSNNKYMFAENGVLYYGSLSINGISYKHMFYPPAKKDTVFEFTSKCNLVINGTDFCGNPYIETIKCPKSTYIYTIFNQYGSPKQLKSIMLKSTNTNTQNTSEHLPISYY